jgi:hypothetical protein
MQASTAYDVFQQYWIPACSAHQRKHALIVPQVAGMPAKSLLHPSRE